MEVTKLEQRLRELLDQLHKLETVEMEKITEKRILADMGDDFRENEGAKLVMDDHNILNLRRWQLKKEILKLKVELVARKVSERKGK